MLSAIPSGPASILKPFSASNSGKADPITAPSPIKKVCTLNPIVLCETDKLSATSALKGSIATLKEASMIITIPAPIHKAGSKNVKCPELGKKIKAILDKRAPIKK